MVLQPSLVLAFLLATIYGLAFYIVFGRGWLRLGLFWLIGVLGFFLGQGLANLVGLALFNIGEVNLVEGTIVSWLSLVAVNAWRNK
jgi:hypothetical protein